MGLEVGQIDEVESSPNNSYQLNIVSFPGHDTEEDLLHILILGACPLRDKRYTFCEMSKARMPSHGSKATVNFILTTFATGLCDPADQMILENAFMKLM